MMLAFGFVAILIQFEMKEEGEYRAENATEEALI